MENKDKTVEKKKGFFAKLFEKLDTKLAQKASSGCGCSKDKGKDNKSCCS